MAKLLKRLNEENPATKKSMENRVAHWLKILHLEHWQVKIKWDACLPKDENSEAEIDAGDQYLFASLRLSTDWPYWTEEWADRTILHELLHIFDRERDVAAKSVEDLLKDDAFTIYWKRYEHERENAVDVMAEIIYELYTGD